MEVRRSARRGRILMLQARLWPLRFLEVFPHNVGTARLRLRGIADDGMPYFMKRADPPGVPATELLCSGLANAIGLAVPYFHIGLMPVDDEEVFASRQESGLEDSRLWFQNLLSNPCPPNVARQLSAWFAYDLFINNTDRHINNFLCRDVGGVLTLHGFDFSEALLQEPWPPSPVVRPGCNTLQTRAVLAANGVPLDRNVALEHLDRLGVAPADWMRNAVAEVPTPWLDAPARLELDRWWREDRASRLDTIKQDINDGAYN